MWEESYKNIIVTSSKTVRARWLSRSVIHTAPFDTSSLSGFLKTGGGKMLSINLVKKQQRRGDRGRGGGGGGKLISCIA